MGKRSTTHGGITGSCGSFGSSSGQSLARNSAARTVKDRALAATPDGASRKYSQRLPQQVRRSVDQAIRSDRVGKLAGQCNGLQPPGHEHPGRWLVLPCLPSHAHGMIAGREVVKVEPAYTSQTCSGCGALFEHLSLSDRWVSCACGTSLDRDHNAAINILQRGLGQSLWASSSAMAELAQEAAAL